MTKTYDEANELMVKSASNCQQVMYDRTMRKVVPGIIQMDAFNALSKQLLALSKQMQHFVNKTQVGKTSHVL